MNNKLMVFAQKGAQEEEDQSHSANLSLVEPWEVLVVDDDQAIHDVTSLILEDYQYASRPLKLTHAYSGAEAAKCLAENSNFAVVLLDVVMETEHAGLDLVNTIRNDLNNQFVRIVLRTGQPGQAPELRVIVDYDINDYRTKTELTADKTRACMTAALRSYKDIRTIQELATTREELQRKVAQRNAQLEEINNKLRQEIEERFAVEELLASTNEKLESIINNSNALISLKAVDGRYDMVNASFTKALKLNTANVIGAFDSALFDEDTAAMIQGTDNLVVKNREALQCEEILPTPEGEHYYLCVKFPLLDNEGEVYRICNICTDITERLEAQNQILHLSQYDVLTDLPNRSLFLDRLLQAVTHNAWHTHHLAVMVIDLDRFKVINDTLSHAVGDQLLKQVAERLNDLVRGTDTVCRLGGDEFAVLLTEITRERDIVNMAEKIMDVLSDHYIVAGQELIITASIGIARCPVDGREVQMLMKKADVAMYKAKKAGRNAFRFYSSDDDHRATDQLALELELRKMLREAPDQMFLMYQPKVNFCNGTFDSVEALVRWQHPKRGVISPAQFIPLLEDTGLIVEAGDWILREACLFAVRMASAGQEIKVAVNLSTRQLKQESLVAHLQTVMKQTGCKARWLELEVTEGSLVDDIERTKTILDEISAMGITLAIDDFGTGYSSMNYLKRLPFNTLKIDRSFVIDAPVVDQDKAIITTIAQLAHNLNMGIVAEGVETTEQYGLLKQIVGDDMRSQIQGYIFSRPVREEALLGIARDIHCIWDKVNTTDYAKLEL